jgi:hypothetical protein
MQIRGHDDADVVEIGVVKDQCSDHLSAVELEPLQLRCEPGRNRMSSVGGKRVEPNLGISFM